MQNSMVSRHYRQRTEKQHDFGLIYGQNIGCRPGVLAVKLHKGYRDSILWDLSKMRVQLRNQHKPIAFIRPVEYNIKGIHLMGVIKWNL